MGTAHYFDCPQCGEVGQASELKEHPTRPMPTDLGFCFACGAEIEQLLDLGEAHQVLSDYGDPDVALMEIDQRANDKVSERP